MLAESTATAPISLTITGSCDGLPELRDALLENRQFEVLGWSESIREAAAALSASHVQVVLHATRGLSLLSKELTMIREHTRKPIVVLASHESETLLEAAVEGRVADLVLLPQSPENVMFAIRKAVFASEREWVADAHLGDGRVVTVFSPKGGAGKTIVATNLAVAFAGSSKTLLLDLDLQFGDTSIMLGIRPSKTLFDLVTAPGELDAEKLTGFVDKHPSGLHVLSAPLRPDEAEFVTDSKIAHVLAIARQAYERIVVDTSPTFYGQMLAALDNTDELLLVCVPEVPTVKNALVTLRTLELLSFPIERIRIVLNRSTLKSGLGSKDVEEALGRKIAYSLPEDSAVQAGLGLGDATIRARPKSDFSQALRRTTKLLDTQLRANGRPSPTNGRP
jgi:pilus assembly protein CpaE